jgi:hypothetical protein
VVSKRQSTPKRFLIPRQHQASPISVRKLFPNSAQLTATIIANPNNKTTNGPPWRTKTNYLPKQEEDTVSACSIEIAESCSTESPSTKAAASTKITQQWRRQTTAAKSQFSRTSCQ